MFFKFLGLVGLVVLTGSPSSCSEERAGSSLVRAKKVWTHAVIDTAVSSIARRQEPSPYGSFPQPKDPFQFLPCTNKTVPPALDDHDPKHAWQALFDPDPAHWNWGNRTDNKTHDDPYAFRGIHLCGYIDLPLDYTNKSDARIVRLAVNKFQASGLARIAALAGNQSNPLAGRKSNRTIVVNPGGPGGSGVVFAWRSGEAMSKRFSNGTFDVLGWDPRGVNASQPAISCFPFDAARDRWSQLTQQYREAVSGSPMVQLQLVDAMNDAKFRACKERHGDMPRFVSTAMVARDLEEIRKALGEDDLTAYLVSYGTGIGQTYANMFPRSVGRMILDGTEYVRDQRTRDGFGTAALDNVTAAWRDGFLGECVSAGPEHCALAKEKGGKTPRREDLEDRMSKLISSLAERPIAAYTNSSGPSIITYSSMVEAIYSMLYSPGSWPAFAQMLYELEDGNSTLAAAFLERSAWQYSPAMPPSPRPSSRELGTLVICADAWDAGEPPEGLAWWGELWANMTARSWIAGNGRFSSVHPCRHFLRHFAPPAEVYRGDLNNTLKNPVLLIAETYDPATPLRNGRRLLAEMGPNARLIAHHGYGHSSVDHSNCTDAIATAYITKGELPDQPESSCYADEKPYLRGVKAGNTTTAKPDETGHLRDPVAVWQAHVDMMQLRNPALVAGG